MPISTFVATAVCTSCPLFLPFSLAVQLPVLSFGGCSVWKQSVRLTVSFTQSAIRVVCPNRTMSCLSIISSISTERKEAMRKSISSCCEEMCFSAPAASRITPSRHCHALHSSVYTDTSYDVHYRPSPLHSALSSLVNSDSVFVCSSALSSTPRPLLRRCITPAVSTQHLCYADQAVFFALPCVVFMLPSVGTHCNTTPSPWWWLLCVEAVSPSDRFLHTERYQGCLPKSNYVMFVHHIIYLHRAEGSNEKL